MNVRALNGCCDSPNKGLRPGDTSAPERKGEPSIPRPTAIRFILSYYAPLSVNHFAIGTILGLVVACSHESPQVALASSGESAITVCGPPNYDAGSVPTGIPIQASFVLQSSGSGPAAIDKITGDCGCSVVGLELQHGAAYTLGDPIAPGEQLTCRVSVDTRGREGSFATRTQLISGTRLLTVEIKATVIPVLIAEPSKFDLGCGLLGGDEHCFRAEITSPLLEGFCLSLDRESLRKDVVASVHPVGNADSNGRYSTWLLEVAVTPSVVTDSYIAAVPIVAVGPWRSSEIARPDGDAFRKNVFVYGRITGPIYAEEPRVSFGAVSAGATSQKMVLVRAHPGQVLDWSQFEVGLTSLFGDWLGGKATATKKTTDEGLLVAISLEVPAAAPERVFRAELVVSGQIGESDYALHVPVYGVNTALPRR